MDTAYLKLTTGTRIKNYLGLVMEEGRHHRAGKNYLFIEVPIRGADVEDEGSTHLIKRNQHVFIHCGCTVNVKGPNIVEVEPNPSLAEWGQVQAGYKVHPDSGLREVGFWFTARKDTDLSQLEYGARLYLIA